MKKLEKSFCLFLIFTSFSFSYIAESAVIALKTNFQGQGQDQEEVNKDDSSNKNKKTNNRKYLTPNSCCSNQIQSESTKPYSFYYPYEFEYYYPDTD